MAFINRDQTFFDQPAPTYLGQSTNIVSIPNIINCITINGVDITSGIITPAGNPTLTGIWTFTNPAASTSPTTGAIRVTGGIGTQGTISATQTSIWSPNQTTGHFDITVANVTGDTTFSRSAGTSRDYIFNGDATTGSVIIQSSAVSAGSTSGALVVYGGIGLTGAMNSTGSITSQSDVIAYGATVAGAATQNIRFAVSYATITTAEIGAVPAPITIIGAPAVVGGKLALLGYAANALIYDAATNILDALQAGTVRFDYTPNYAGTPVGFDQYIYTQACQNDNSPFSIIYIVHRSASSFLQFAVASFDGTASLIGSFLWNAGSTPACVMGVEYHIELDYDTTVSVARLFINGVQVGATATAVPFVRAMGTIKQGIGTWAIPGFGTPHNEFYIRNVEVYKNMVHVADFTPGPIGGITIYGPTSLESPVSVWSPDRTTGYLGISVADTTGDATFSRAAGTTRNYIFTGDATTGSVVIQSTVPNVGPGTGALIVAGDAEIQGVVNPSATTVSGPVAALIFAASYSTSFDPELASNPLYTTSGTISITGGKLDLTAVGNKYINNQATLMTTAGTFKCKFTPNYAAPGANQILFSVGNVANMFEIRHNPGTNNFTAFVTDNGGTTRLSVTFPYVFLSGTEVIVEVGWSLPLARIGVWFDGTLTGSNTGTNGVRGTGAFWHIGTNYPAPGNPANAANFWMRDVMIYNTMLHTTLANYVSTNYTTLGLDTTVISAASAIIDNRVTAQNVTCTTVPSAPTDVTRLSEFSSSFILLSAGGACNATPVQVQQIRIGTIVIITFQRRINLTANGVGGTIQVTPFNDARYFPAAVESVSMVQVYDPPALYTPGYAKSTSLGYIEIVPTSGTYTNVGGTSIGWNGFCMIYQV